MYCSAVPGNCKSYEGRNSPPLFPAVPQSLEHSLHTGGTNAHEHGSLTAEMTGALKAAKTSGKAVKIVRSQ